MGSVDDCARGLREYENDFTHLASIFIERVVDIHGALYWRVTMLVSNFSTSIYS